MYEGKWFARLFFDLKVQNVALQSAINCIKEHPMMCHQPFHDSLSRTKVHIIIEMSKYLCDFW